MFRLSSLIAVFVTDIFVVANLPNNFVTVNLFQKQAQTHCRCSRVVFDVPNLSEPKEATSEPYLQRARVVSPRHHVFII